MPSQLSLINIDPDSMDFLERIYPKFTEDMLSPFMLKLKDGNCVEVEVYHNLAYRFCNKGSVDVYCVVYWLDFNVSGAKAEDQAELIIVERQKRGLPHVTPCNVLILMETDLSLKNVEEIFREML